MGLNKKSMHEKSTDVAQPKISNRRLKVHISLNHYMFVSRPLDKSSKVIAFY